VAGSPVEALKIPAKRLPEVEAHAFALGLRLDRELAQVGPGVAGLEDRGPAILLVDVRGEDRLLEKIRR
jgi:hypothetical protein